MKPHTLSILVENRAVVLSRVTGEAVGDGEPLSQGAGGNFHSRGAAGVGVSLEDAAELAQAGQLLPGKKPRRARTA